MRCPAIHLALVVLGCCASPAIAKEWAFNVYLDGKEIGQHRFAAVTANGQLELTSEASFNVRFLFFNAYKYRHVANEKWQGDCLVSLVARTEENRQISLVAGRKLDDGFAVDGPQGKLKLPPCTMTFAYWNPQMLKRQRLLNPQTGEFQEVRIDSFGQETITVRGRPVRAERYRLTATKMQIDLWYSLDQEWLALESTTPTGHLISYKLR